MANRMLSIAKSKKKKQPCSVTLQVAPTRPPCPTLCVGAKPKLNTGSSYTPHTSSIVLGFTYGYKHKRHSTYNKNLVVSGHSAQN